MRIPFQYICISSSNSFFMEANQVKLLASLAKKIKSEKKSKNSAKNTLLTAKILTKKGNLTKQYTNLKKVVVASK